jgi:hypothetical protein
VWIWKAKPQVLRRWAGWDQIDAHLAELGVNIIPREDGKNWAVVDGSTRVIEP